MDAAEWKRRMEQAVQDWGRVQEIRIRAGKPVMVWMDGKEWWLLKSGGLLEAGADRTGRKPQEGRPQEEKTQEGRPQEEKPRGGRPAAVGPRAGSFWQPGSPEVVAAEKGLIRELLEMFTRHSLYAFDEEIRQGYLTIEGGHRVGIAGRVILEGETVRNIKDISGLNIRLAHEITGCADGILPWLYEDGRIVNTLLVSPPGGGKTTMLRDLIRQTSDGNPHGEGVFVSVVDERSEIGACFQGVPQCDLGIRTDVMDGCPKVQGMLMMIRSMAPRVLAVDEIGTREDLEAMEAVMNCGCRILATVHGRSVEDLKQKPVWKQMLQEKRFERYVVLGRTPHPGTVMGVYDEALMEMDKR